VLHCSGVPSGASTYYGEVDTPDPVDRELTRRRIRISGRVQGVGFRYFVMRAAQALDVSGWVENCRDGSVLCEAQAGSEVMDRFQARLGEGPSFSRVEKLEVDELEPRSESFSGFEIH
jgi:acylphosphatase